MSINTFISGFKGGARPNRFRVQITYPALVGAPDVLDEIVVQSAQLPASVMGQILVPYQGRQIPIPGDRTFEDWTCTVLNDVTFSHRNIFEKWSNLINAHEGNIQGAEYEDIVATIDVTQLDRAGENILKVYKLHNAWPTNIMAIDLGQDQNDVLETYQVTFSYSHWTSTYTPTT